LRSAALFSFTARDLSDLGLDMGFDMPAADLVCENLFFELLDDATAYASFLRAYVAGGSFADMPLGTLRGAPLTAEVVRDCAADDLGAELARSAYGGVASSELGQAGRLGTRTYHASLVPAGVVGLDSRVIVQNAGSGPSRVEAEFRDSEDCGRTYPCPDMGVAPGESLVLSPSACAQGRLGSLILRSSEPLAVAVDVVAGSGLASYTAVAGSPAAGAERPVVPSAQAGSVLFGPLVLFDPDRETDLFVQNMDADTAAHVRLTWIDRDGETLRVDEGSVCPGGGRSFAAPRRGAGVSSTVGSVRVESLPVDSEDPSAAATAPPIAGVLYTTRSDSMQLQAPDSGAYALLGGAQALLWPTAGPGSGGSPVEDVGGTATGVAALAVPALSKAIAEPNADGADTTTDLAIANLVAAPGFTDFVIYLYDQNALMDYVCEKLNEKQVEYIRLDTWGYVNPGFAGSAIVSAVFWEHDVFADDGLWLRNLVGLGGVTVQHRDAGPAGPAWSDPLAQVELPALSPEAVRAIDPPIPLCAGGGPVH
jgi:hypothetical protein